MRKVAIPGHNVAHCAAVHPRYGHCWSRRGPNARPRPSASTGAEWVQQGALGCEKPLFPSAMSPIVM